MCTCTWMCMYMCEQTTNFSGHTLTHTAEDSLTVHYSAVFRTAFGDSKSSS